MITITTIIIDGSDDELEELHQAGCETEECESDEDTTGTQTADGIVSASLTSGVLSTVCRVEIQDETRLIDDQERCIHEFVDRGCGCDYGPNKSQCSLIFPADHYRELRATFAATTSWIS